MCVLYHFLIPFYTPILHQVEAALRKCQAEAGEAGLRLLKAAEEEKVGYI